MKKLNLGYNRIILSEGCDRNMAKALESVWTVMEGSNWLGACHATTSIIYILLAELGYEPEIYIGELILPGSFHKFDHSWIEVNGKVIDLAIALPLNQVGRQEPVVMGREVISSKVPNMKYKSQNFPPNFDYQAQKVKDVSIYKYLEEAPEQIYEYFNKILQDVIPNLSKDDIKEKYSDTYRQVK